MSDCKTCTHINYVSDSHEGTLVCTDCGLVLDQIFVFNETEHNQNTLQETNDDVFQEMLHRLNVTISENKTNENKSMQNIACSLYTKINKESAVSIKEISSVTGVSEKKINLQTKGSVTLVDKNILLEKYCCQLNLTFKQYTVIKELLNQQHETGHNPITLISSCIYFYCRQNKLKISMKKVSEITGISCISIQRFLKHIKT